MIGLNIRWSNVQSLPTISYNCGFCCLWVASEKGWSATLGTPSKTIANIRICSNCNSPTFFDATGKQIPGIVFGNSVTDITDKFVTELYDEARNATGSNCYTAAVLCCRKLLMHIAVSKGANPGESFVKYVKFLADNNYVPPDAKNWVDHIRKKGNEANHEIVIMSKEDAEELLSFLEMLLKIIYEFPAVIKRKIQGPDQ